MHVHTSRSLDPFAPDEIPARKYAKPATGALAAGALAVLLAWLVGCEPEQCTPRWSPAITLECIESGARVPDNLPVDLMVEVDATAPRGDTEVAQAMAGITLRGAEEVIARGGRLRIMAFAGNAPHARRVIEVAVPTLAELRPSRRSDMEEKVRTAVRTRVREALAAVPAESGSDVTGAFGELGTIKRTPKAILAGLVVGDGREYQPRDFNLLEALAADPDAATKTLVERMRRPTPAPAAVAMVGLNLTGGPGDDPGVTRALVAAWQTACVEILPAAHCLITATS